MGDRGARREAGGDHERQTDRQTDRDRQRGKRMGREIKIAGESTEGREGRERERFYDAQSTAYIM